MILIRVTSIELEPNFSQSTEIRVCVSHLLIK